MLALRMYACGVWLRGLHENMHEMTNSMHAGFPHACKRFDVDNVNVRPTCTVHRNIAEPHEVSHTQYDTHNARTAALQATYHVPSQDAASTIHRICRRTPPEGKPSLSCTTLSVCSPPSWCIGTLHDVSSTESSGAPTVYGVSHQGF